MDDKPSPGLNLCHGFVHKIRQELVKRDQLEKVLETEKVEITKKQLAGLKKPTTRRPTQATYVPPAARRERERNSSTSSTVSTSSNDSSSGDSDVLTATAGKPTTGSTSATSVKEPPCQDMATQRNSASVHSSVHEGLREEGLPLSESAKTNNYLYGVDGFGKEAQRYIVQALQDPTSLRKQDLCQVFNIVMWRAMEEPDYARTGAELCHAIIQVEVEKEQFDCVPTRVFQSHLRLKLLEQEMEAETLHEESVSVWVGFVRFLCLCYHVIRVKGSPLLTMVDSVFNCLSMLALPGPLKNEMEVDCLYNLLVVMGPTLDQTVPDMMEDLFGTLRDRFLSFKTPAVARHRLLQLVELRSGGWEMDQGVQEYYSRTGMELKG